MYLIHHLEWEIVLIYTSCIVPALRLDTVFEGSQNETWFLCLYLKNTSTSIMRIPSFEWQFFLYICKAFHAYIYIHLHMQSFLCRYSLSAPPLPAKTIFKWIVKEMSSGLEEILKKYRVFYFSNYPAPNQWLLWYHTFNVPLNFLWKLIML